ncbi:protein huluwa-like [Bombina bombina]|uniref:protein huluwa-like n=1 Tax=Bombina bombina TaxID=8345 RepID=UPI00235B0F14|nr:protein huluwa-like [Bombina bombina]
MGTLTPSYAPLDGGTPVANADQKLVLQPTLTLLVILLIPCVVLLFLLNCFLLFHRLPVFSQKKREKRRGSVRNKYSCLRNNKTGQAQPEQSYGTTSSKPLCQGRCMSDNVNQGLEATMVLGEGVKEPRCRPHSRDSCHKMDRGNRDSCSPCPACVMPMPCCSSRRSWHPPACVRPPEGATCWNQGKDDKVVVPHSSGSSSDMETRHNAVPPNTPAAAIPTSVTPKVKFSNKTSTQRKHQGSSVPYTPLGSLQFDYASSIPQEDSCAHLSTSSNLPGPGLDSDFGVSAGISLHILSSDSDSCSQSWASGMEWDYYDPCYMRRNRRHRDNRLNHHLPVICSKQYWV